MILYTPLARRKTFMLSRTLLRTCASTTFLLGMWLVASVPARAGTISITYSLSATGMPTVTGMTSTSLDLTGTSTGSVDQWNPVVNAVWNPVTYTDNSVLNLVTGLLNGTFNMTFHNGDVLSGLVFEDDSMVNPATATGPLTQILTFTAGTGEFAGVSGFTSGGGLLTPTGFTASGS